MFCANCGNQIPENSNKCSMCGWEYTKNSAYAVKTDSEVAAVQPDVPQQNTSTQPGTQQPQSIQLQEEEQILSGGDLKLGDGIKNAKKFPLIPVIIAGLAVLIGIIIVVTLLVSNGGKSSSGDLPISCSASFDVDSNAYFYKDGQIIKVNGEFVSGKMSPNGKYIALITEDRDIVVYENQNGKAVKLERIDQDDKDCEIKNGLIAVTDEAVFYKKYSGKVTQKDALIALADAFGVDSKKVLDEAYDIDGVLALINLDYSIILENDYPGMYECFRYKFSSKETISLGSKVELSGIKMSGAVAYIEDDAIYGIGINDNAPQKICDAKKGARIVGNNYDNSIVIWSSRDGEEFTISACIDGKVQKLGVIDDINYNTALSFLVDFDLDGLWDKGKNVYVSFFNNDSNFVIRGYESNKMIIGGKNLNSAAVNFTEEIEAVYPDDNVVGFSSSSKYKLPNDNVKKLLVRVYQDSKTSYLYEVGLDGSKEKLASGVESVKTKNNKILYTKNDGLYVCSWSNKRLDNEELVARNVESFYFAPDGKHIIYILNENAKDDYWEATEAAAEEAEADVYTNPFKDAYDKAKDAYESAHSNNDSHESGDMYCVRLDNLEEEKIASDVESVTFDTDGNMYFMSEVTKLGQKTYAISGTLSFYNFRDEPVRIGTDISSIEDSYYSGVVSRNPIVLRHDYIKEINGSSKNIVEAGIIRNGHFEKVYMDIID